MGERIKKHIRNSKVAFNVMKSLKAWIKNNLPKPIIPYMKKRR
jgi:hypothetical protein